MNDKEQHIEAEEEASASQGTDGADNVASPEDAEECDRSKSDKTEKSDKSDKGGKKRQKQLEAELAETKKKLADTEATQAEEHDKYLRLYAEYDNYRRRTAKEKEAIYGDATVDAVKGILPVIDTLERAVEGFAPEDAESPLGKGITMTLKSATDALAKLGVEVIEADTFNPDLHNAVMHVEDDTLPEGAIVEVFQKGYRKGDRIIRYAMVKVAN